MSRYNTSSCVTRSWCQMQFIFCKIKHNRSVNREYKNNYHNHDHVEWKSFEHFIWPTIIIKNDWSIFFLEFHKR